MSKTNDGKLIQRRGFQVLTDDGRRRAYNVALLDNLKSKSITS